MSNPTIPISARFRTDIYRGGHLYRGDGQLVAASGKDHRAERDWFLCGDNVWRPIAELKSYDAKHGTHFAEDCANAARVACENECLELQESYSIPYRSGADADAAQDADRLDRDAAAWAAWMREEG